MYVGAKLVIEFRDRRDDRNGEMLVHFGCRGCPIFWFVFLYQVKSKVDIIATRR